MNKLVGMFFTGVQVKKSINWTESHPCWKGRGTNCFSSGAV